MAPKRRSTSTRHFPVGLNIKTIRGDKRFMYRYPCGKEFLMPKSTSEYDAVEAAAIFNGKPPPVGLNLFGHLFAEQTY